MIKTINGFLETVKSMYPGKYITVRCTSAFHPSSKVNIVEYDIYVEGVGWQNRAHATPDIAVEFLKKVQPDFIINEEEEKPTNEPDIPFF